MQLYLCGIKRLEVFHPIPPAYLKRPHGFHLGLVWPCLPFIKGILGFAAGRLIGLRASQVSEGPYEQLSLFDTEQSRKMKELEKAVDKIRGKYGVDSIKRASFLKEDALVDHAVSKKKHLQQKERQI